MRFCSREKQCLSNQIESLVEQILKRKQADPGVNVSELEQKIDQLVYQLYGLTAEEIAIVEGRGGTGKSEGEITKVSETFVISEITSETPTYTAAPVHRPTLRRNLPRAAETGTNLSRKGFPCRYSRISCGSGR